MRVTVPSTTSPFCRSRIVRLPGSIMVRLMRLRSRSSFLIHNSTSWPSCSTSDTLPTRLAESSEICTRPSRPTPISTKAPNSVMRLTLPFTCWPTLSIRTTVPLASTAPVHRLIPPYGALASGSCFGAATASGVSASRSAPGSLPTVLPLPVLLRGGYWCSRHRGFRRTSLLQQPSPARLGPSRRPRPRRWSPR